MVMKASAYLLFLLNLLSQGNFYHSPVLDDLSRLLILLLLLGGLKLLIMSELTFFYVRAVIALLQLLRAHTARSQLVRLKIISPYHFLPFLSCDLLRQELDVELSILMIPSQAIKMLPETDPLAQGSLPNYGLYVRRAAFHVFLLSCKNWRLDWCRLGFLNDGG